MPHPQLLCFSISTIIIVRSCCKAYTLVNVHSLDFHKIRKKPKAKSDTHPRHGGRALETNELNLEKLVSLSMLYFIFTAWLLPLAEINAKTCEEARNERSQTLPLRTPSPLACMSSNVFLRFSDLPLTASSRALISLSNFSVIARRFFLLFFISCMI